MYPCVSHTAPMKEYTHIHVHTHGKHTHANKETHTDSNMYIPNECSVHTMLRVIVNIAVAAGVISTNYITFTSAFTACSFSLVISCGLSLSLVSCEDWSAIRSRISTAKQKID